MTSSTLRATNSSASSGKSVEVPRRVPILRDTYPNDFPGLLSLDGERRRGDRCQQGEEQGRAPWRDGGASLAASQRRPMHFCTPPPLVGVRLDRPTLAELLTDAVGN